MEFISQLRRYKSCNQSQNGCQTSQTRYSKPVRHNSEYRTILTSVCALFACDVVCICTKCHVSRVQHTVHSRRRSHAACSHSARGRPDLMQDGITQLSHARVSRQGASHSTPRVYSSVMLTLVRLVPMATAAAAQGSPWPRKSSTTADLSCVGRHSRRLERARPRHSNAACVSWHAQSGMLSQAPADNTGDGNMQREAKAHRRAVGETHQESKHP